MTPLEEVRRQFAEQVRTAVDLKTPAIVVAFARVARERFLGPGPWIIRAEREPSRTPDADPRHVYQNVSIAIDASRDLFNGQPSLIASWIEALGVGPGQRVLHIGCATGYYSAILAELTGPGGRVFGVEVDPDLASRARQNLRDWPWVEVSEGDGRSALPSGVDVVLIHAGATHVLDEWLDAVADGGRLLVPLTCTFPGLSSSLSKGAVLVVTRDGGRWRARFIGMVVIYALAGARDDEMNARLGRALMSGTWQSVTTIRRDPHEPNDTCWLHGPTCLGTG